MVEVLAINALVTGLALLFLWGLSVRLSDVSIVDIFWGPGFALIAVTSLILTGEIGPVSLLLVALTCLWSARLGAHLAARWLAHGKKEDRRYAAMRRKTGERFAMRSLLTVFAFQGAIMWIVSLPLQIGITLGSDMTLGLPSLAGSLLFLIGFTLEAAADQQLKEFKEKTERPEEVLQTGVWAWSRHPNYFGNACLWWGLYLIAAEVPAALPTIVSPVLMTFLLLRVSGVALLERGLVRSKPGYVTYRENVSAFLPLPPGWKRSERNDGPE